METDFHLPARIPARKSQQIKMKLIYIPIVFLFFSSTALYADVSDPNIGKSVNSQESWRYIVLKGDSFEKIYQQYLARRANILALSQLNKHKLTKKLQPGQVLTIPISMLKKIPMTTEVITATGEVLMNKSASNEASALQVGEKLTEGASLRTGKNSVCKLRFADGTVTKIQGNANLTIESSYKYAGIGTYVIHLKQIKGRTETSANPNHQPGNSIQIETPSAVAAVRGTEFRVSAESDATLEETLEGLVALKGAQQEVMIAKDFGSKVEKDKAPSAPVSLLEAPDVASLPKEFNRMPVVFNIQPLKNAAAYQVQLSRDAHFSQLITEQAIQRNSEELTKIEFNNLVEGKYYLKLRAEDSQGLQGKDAIHEFNILALATLLFSEPELIEPMDNATIFLAPTLLSWTEIPAAKNYLVQFSRDEHFDNIIFEFTTATNQLTIDHSFGAGQYFWRVAVLHAGEPQKYSHHRMFNR